ELVEKILDRTGLGDSWDLLREQLTRILDKWDALGENGAAVVWSFLDERVAAPADVDLNQLKEQLNKLTDPNQTSARALFENLMEKGSFDESHLGRFISAITNDGDALFALIDDSSFTRLQEKLRSLLELLNLNEQLTKFHNVISDELRLDRIKKALNTDPEELGVWMSNKVSTFLSDEDNQLMTKVRQLDQFIDKIRSQKAQIFEKTKAVLQKEYGASLAFSYQKSTARTALLDASFTLGEGTSSLAIYHETISGDFDRLLSSQTDGIRLHKGVLTEGITKEKSLSLSLPFAQKNLSKLTKSAASGTFIDEADGRLMVFEAEASETIRRSRRYTQMVLNGYYSLKKTERATGNKEKSMSLSFESKLAREKYMIKSLKQVLEPFIKDYLIDSFEEQGNNAVGQVDEWINDMADQIDKVKPNGKRNFGRTLINLELKVPQSVGEAWFKLPDDAKAYGDLYEVVQQQIRKTIYHYFIESEQALNQHNRDDLFGVLLYEAFPIIERLKINRKNKVTSHWRNSDRNATMRRDRDQRDILLQLVTRLANMICGKPGPQFH
ncbi:MAG: hypothetical protein AAFO69_19000, partial [Bacteroidota bacterium]